MWLAVGAVGAVSEASVRVGEGGGERVKRRDRDTRVRGVSVVVVVVVTVVGATVGWGIRGACILF